MVFYINFFFARTVFHKIIQISHWFDRILNSMTIQLYWLSILYWPLDPPKKSFIYLNAFFSWVILAIECRGLNSDNLSAVVNVWVEKIPPCRINWLTFFVVAHPCFSNWKFKPTKIQMFITIDLIKLKNSAAHRIISGWMHLIFFLQEREWEKFENLMKIGQTKCNQSQFSTLHRVPWLFDEDFFLYFAYTYTLI